jgi:hypothetical protein
MVNETKQRIEMLKGICLNLVNIPLEEKGTYESEEANGHYHCSITRSNCVGQYLDDSRNGPPPMCYTFYLPKIDTAAMFKCPVRNLSEALQRELKRLKEVEEKERRILDLEKQLASLPREIENLKRGKK